MVAVLTLAISVLIRKATEVTFATIVTSLLRLFWSGEFLVFYYHKADKKSDRYPEQFVQYKIDYTQYFSPNERILN
jgi:hypothetical protein